MVLNEKDEMQVLLERKPLVLVEFWADWCGPCRSIAPIMDSLEEELSDTLAIGRVNVDDVPDLAETYHISSIPTVMLFKDKAAVERMVGAHKYAEYRAAIAAHDGSVPETCEAEEGENTVG